MINVLLEKYRSKKKREFAARLKWGDDWKRKLYPQRYTRSTAPK